MIDIYGNRKLKMQKQQPNVDAGNSFELDITIDKITPLGIALKHLISSDEEGGGF